MYEIALLNIKFIFSNKIRPAHNYEMEQIGYQPC